MDVEVGKKDKEEDKSKKIETLLVGDDLGIVHMYDFKRNDWHYC